MSRFYAPKENVKDRFIVIDGQEAKHIMNVMRLSVNDRVVVFDGTGKEYVGFIKETKPKALTVEIIETRIPKPESPCRVTLVQAIPKKDKMDYIVEKATELGVSEIIPVVTKRTIVRMDDHDAKERVDRWRKLAREASKQCGRLDIPIINDTVEFIDFLDMITDYDLCLFAVLNDKTVPLRQALTKYEKGNILVFIGPEGDFTPEETALSNKVPNINFVSLGKRVLKSDTAGLYVISCINYELSK